MRAKYKVCLKEQKKEQVLKAQQKVAEKAAQCQKEDKEIAEQQREAKQKQDKLGGPVDEENIHNILKTG